MDVMLLEGVYEKDSYVRDMKKGIRWIKEHPAREESLYPEYVNRLIGDIEDILYMELQDRCMKAKVFNKELCISILKPYDLIMEGDLQTPSIDIKTKEDIEHAEWYETELSGDIAPLTGKRTYIRIINKDERGYSY